MPRVFRTRCQPLLAWLCLICFGLGQTLLTGGLVICRDGHGATSLELGCLKNTASECTTACEATDCTAPDEHPCQDTPLGKHNPSAKAPPRDPGTCNLIPPLCAVMFERPLDFAATALTAPPSLPQRHRPPDPLHHMQSVILLV